MGVLVEVELFKISQPLSSRDRIRTQSTSPGTLITITNPLTENIMARWYGQAVTAAHLRQSSDAIL